MSKSAMTPCQWHALLLIEDGRKQSVAILTPKSVLKALWTRKWIDHALDVTREGDKAMNAERAARGLIKNALGEDGVRDPDNPCQFFTTNPLEHHLTADCDSDGHYLCAKCKLRANVAPHEEHSR